MKRVRDSAFGHPPLTTWQRLGSRRRYHAEAGRYPHLLTRRECWTVRAEADDELVGFAWAYLVGERTDWAYIDDVAVHADHQGGGVGSALIDDMVSWLRDHGIVHITGYPTTTAMALIFGHHRITPGIPPDPDDDP